MMSTKPLDMPALAGDPRPREIAAGAAPGPTVRRVNERPFRQLRGRVRRSEESPGAWLTAAQNDLLAVRHTADGAQAGAPRPVPDCVIDSRAGCRMIELFAAIFPIEWG